MTNRKKVYRWAAACLTAAVFLTAAACTPREPDSLAPDESALSSAPEDNSQTPDQSQASASEGSEPDTTTAPVVSASQSTRPNGTTAGSKPGASTTATKATTKPTAAPSGLKDGETVLCGGERYVVDYVVNTACGADPTGKTSSTDAINRALTLIGYSGGGTVYLPAGTYLIDGILTIPAFTTLLGDWKDPDKGESGGTILSVSESMEGSLSTLILLNGSAGAVGLTIHYPGQKLDNVKEYPATFGLQSGSMLQTIRNIFLVNAYTGISYPGVSGAHEMLTVDNVKGTVLHCGASVFNQADVGTWKNVSFGPQYWANAKGSLKGPDKAAIAEYTRAHATGIRAGDLEWTEFLNLTLSGFQYGFQVVKGVRIEFAGSLYNAQITDCGEALRVEAIDTRWGMLVANSTLSGSSYAVNNQTGGLVKMCGVKTTGSVAGTVTRTDADLSFMSTADAKPATPAARVYNAGKYADTGSDAAKDIQTLLDKAGKAGGGIVYLPAGRYLLESALTVPAGVELLGSSATGVRGVGGNPGGTILIVTFGRENTAAAAATATAAITLSGKNAGVRGLQMVWPDELDALKDKTSVPWAYGIRGKASGVYAIDVCLAGAYNGIDFSNCDNHYIRRAVTCCLNNAMTVGGENGTVETCLQNATVLARMGSTGEYAAFNESDLFTHVFNPVTRPNTTYIKVAANASGQRVMNTFAYGVHTLVENAGRNTRLCNLGADNLGGTMINITGGALNGVNLMRWNGSSYAAGSGATVHLYNRLTIHIKDEQNF